VTTQPASLVATLKLGVIQTSLDPLAAWAAGPKMSPCEEERAILEIKNYFAALRQEQTPPDIVVLPELSVPVGFEGKLRAMASKLESVVIAGFDYRTGDNPNEVHNEALLIVPKRWRGKAMGSRTMTRRIGKTYAAPEEDKNLKSIGYTFKKDPSVWLFDGDEIGTFGVMVCYDFLDLERIAMYRGKVHHLFILALNKDATSFRHVAEAVARMVFCNVIICNCGHFGGSLAVSPYRLSERRTIYRHAGPGLATGQVIELPVAELDLHQRGGNPLKDGVKAFKSLPPGYEVSVVLLEQLAKIS
jgi:predicted amidohydrolase